MNERPTLVSLQYLRAVAAMMVVVHHVLNSRAMATTEELQVDLSRLGVMIFFVLSGFIILHSNAEARPMQFLLRRVIRVVPLYWVLTLVFLAVLFRSDLSEGQPPLRVPSLIASLFFVPYPHAVVSNQIWPVLVQGWTLNFEMLFYGLFALGLVLRRPGLTAAVAVLGLVTLGWLLSPEGAIARTWTDPLMLLFLAGLLIAEARQRFALAWGVWILPLFTGLGLACACGWVGGTRGIAAYAAAVGVVAGCVAVAERYPAFRVPLLGRLGDASYSIYLSHTLFLIVLLPVLGMIPLDGGPKLAVVGVLAVGLSTAGGVLVYDWLERPMTRWLRARLDGPAQPPLPVPS